MAFPDFPFDKKEEKSFVGHSDVQAYLESYCKHFHLNKYIHLGKEVIHVEPMEEDASQKRTKWTVKVRDVDTGETETECFDSVVVCNGHFTVPLYPEIKNIDRFKGIVMHSRFYKKPDPFSGKTVALLGARASGQDIAIDISSVAKKVYLCHRKNRLRSTLPKNVEERLTIEYVDKTGDFVLQDGSRFHADILLFCTGYLYDFPFLSECCQIKLEYGGRVVSPLYKHVVSRIYPSLVFIGLPCVVCPFPLFNYQAKYALAVQEGTLTLPSKTEMEDEVKNDLKEKVEAGYREDQFHTLDNLQWKYMSDLAYHTNTELPGYLQKLYEYVKFTRYNDLQHFRGENFRITENEKDFISLTKVPEIENMRIN